MSEYKDSFGQEVNVGDYLVYATKTKYLGALCIGRVTKFNPSGSLSLTAVCTWGQTMEEALEDARKWGYDFEPFKTSLQSASTCFKVPSVCVPMMIAQVLQAHN